MSAHRLLRRKSPSPPNHSSTPANCQNIPFGRRPKARWGDGWRKPPKCWKSVTLAISVDATLSAIESWHLLNMLQPINYEDTGSCTNHRERSARSPSERPDWLLFERASLGSLLRNRLGFGQRSECIWLGWLLGLGDKKWAKFIW